MESKRSTVAAACSKKKGIREDSLDSTRKKVREHFDDDTSKRDLLFRDPIPAYEQDCRQKAISSLMVGRNYPVCLDAGCGNERDLGIISKRAGQVIGADISRQMLEQARPKTSKFQHRLDLLVCNLTYLPFRHDAVDLIVCSEVLEHVPNWRKAITEFYKALKPRSSIVISTPNKLSMYGLTSYLGRLFFGSKHPYDKWKSYFELRRALMSTGFRLCSSLGACYLPDDVSYYNPFKSAIIRLLNLIRSIEAKVSYKWPLNLLGFMIVVRGIKITVSMF